jgi:hypothetical protein
MFSMYLKLTDTERSFFGQCVVKGKRKNIVTIYVSVPDL